MSLLCREIGEFHNTFYRGLSSPAPPPHSIVMTRTPGGDGGCSCDAGYSVEGCTACRIKRGWFIRLRSEESLVNREESDDLSHVQYGEEGLKASANGGGPGGGSGGGFGDHGGGGGFHFQVSAGRRLNPEN